MRVAIKGFSGYCFLTTNLEIDKQIELYSLLTSFNLSVNTSLLPSGAVNKIFYKNTEQENNTFKRIGLNAVRDFPVYEISLSFQCNLQFFETMLSLMSAGFSTAFKVVLFDNMYNFQYKFEKCYVNEFSFSVQTNSACVLNVSFVYFNETFQIKGPDELSDCGKDIHDKIKKIMPYYKFGAMYGDFPKDNLLSLSLSFSREITPRFGCVGNRSSKAVNPLKLHFALPILTFQLSYLYNEGFKQLSEYSTASNDCLKNTLEIWYSNKKKLTLNDCASTSYTPNLARVDSYNTINVSGRAFGSITVT